MAPFSKPTTTLKAVSESDVQGHGQLNHDQGQGRGHGHGHLDADEVVISGLSGRFPDSDSFDEFRDHLLAGDDMVTVDDRRWPAGSHGIPAPFGKLRDLSRFDAQHFGVHAKQAAHMEPMLRIMLELAHEALVDAGLNPDELRGSNTGVFVGASSNDSEFYWTQLPDRSQGYGATGSTRCMYANRMSFCFDLKGPSYTVDVGCSSSLLAVHHALEAIRTGRCDRALVAGCNLVVQPGSSVQLVRLTMLSPHGRCKSFDRDGDGFARAEAVVVLLLERASVARRRYATVVHAGTNTDGYKEEGILFPSGASQGRLLRRVYAEAGVDPHHVVYVEAHGTGTQVNEWVEREWVPVGALYTTA